MEYVYLAFMLFFGHSLADYALQSDFMATNKNRNAEPKGYNPAIHGPKQVFWPYVLLGHAAIHGGAVSLITGAPVLGLVEFVAHAAIDFGKCERWYGIHLDQWLHFTCKVIYIILIAYNIV